MNQKISNIGIDIIDIKRFNKHVKNRDDKFLVNNFSESELDYCFAYKDAATHLAGTFAAKEAVFKALGKTNILQSAIEIKRELNGRPTAWFKGKIHKKILVSISHTNEIAMAIAIKQ